MEPSSKFLLTIGGILLLGGLTSAIARRTFLPRVTLLLILGIGIGSQALDIIPHSFSDHFGIVADMTLLMVGFLLGGKLGKHSMQKSAAQVLWISISAALVTTIFVTLGLIGLGISIEMSIILGCVASATAPAAIFDVVGESSHQGRFSSLLLSIVALDDVWALVLFGIGLSLVKALSETGGDPFFLWMAFKEIAGAIMLGVIIALPAAHFTGRFKHGQPILTEALAIVFLGGGLAIWLGVSHLITAIVIGAVIANRAKHHTYPFHAIEGVESMMMVIFFVLAGATLELSAVKDIGLMGVAYILCRSAGKYLGARWGCLLGKADPVTKRWIGVALLPQAGVAIGMALVASHQFPEHRQMLLSMVISTTVFFEIIGPIMTRLALQRSQAA